MSSNNKVTINLIQTITEVIFECPQCGWEHQIDYNEFTGIYEEPWGCNWNGEKFECDECGCEMEIDGFDID